MAVVKGTNSGLVSSRPTTDPAGTNSVLDGKVFSQKIAPASDVTVTEIGCWVDTASEEANFEVGIYAHDSANDRPGSLLGSAGTNAKGTGAGWKYAAISVALTGGTTYWVAFQLDNVTTTTNGNYSNETGERYSIANASTLADPWGTTPGIANISLAVYALYTAGGSSVIKSIAGVAQASVKSIAGVAVASVKSICGVSNV